MELKSSVILSTRKVFLTVGREVVNQKMLQLIAELALRQPLTILDCGNRSNIYAVAKLIRPFTPDPVSALNHIRLSRAFTCIQVQALLQAAADKPSPAPVIVLDFLSTFLDQDLKQPEAEKLFSHCLRSLETINLSAPIVISCRPIPAIASERQILFDTLVHFANETWEELSALPSPAAQLPLFA